MRLEQIRIDAFGRLADFDSGAESLPGLVVVLGPNEAGKSTLFRFLATMLYGFHPASREGNPYTPWSGEDAAGSVRLRLDGGGCAEVARQLKSQPSGQLTAEGTTTDLRNRALPWVQHVPATVFDQVFAITLQELAGLDAETWASIQDRLIGSMGASDLLPARAVADDLEAEAGKLWRPHRRGNQKVRDIQEEIRALRARRREAMDRDRELRRLVERLEQTRASLTRAREDRARLKVALERVEALSPVRAQLRRITVLHDEVGNPERLEGIPDAPRVHRTRLDQRLAEIDSRIEQLDLRAAEPRDALARAEGRSRELLDHAIPIRSALTRMAQVDPRRGDALRAELDEIEQQLEIHVPAVVSGPWREVARAPLGALSVTELRDAVREAEAARSERRISEAAAPEQARRPLVPAVVLGVVGIAALAAGLVLTSTPWLLAGAVALAVGLTLVAPSFTARRGANQLGRVDEAGAREAEALERVRALTREISPSPRFLEEPTESLVMTLEHVRALLRAHDRSSAQLRDHEEAIGALAEDVTALRAALAPQTEGGDSDVLGALERDLRQAERDSAGSASAARELDRIERERADLDRERVAVLAERDPLLERLEQLGAGDVEQGLQVAEAAFQARGRAEQLEDELERAHPDLETLKQRIAEAERAEEAWTLSDHDLATTRAEVEELNEKIVDLASTAEALDRDVAHLTELETVDSVDGEIEALSAEQERLARERDRRWVMAQLIREADRRFRDEHQPDVIRRAGAYLEHLTDGRYRRILVDEASGGEIFQLEGPGLAKPVTLGPPLSTGTLEQAYLSLRLAIIDHLDRGGERLPLFIDEAFVNWDRVRRGRGLDVLGAISRGRQTFVFTCHPHVADPLRDAGARVLELGSD